MSSTQFLLDANSWMQIVREHEHVEDVRKLIAAVPASKLFTTELARHSISIAMPDAALKLFMDEQKQS